MYKLEVRAFELLYTPENLLYVNIQNGFVDYEVSMELNSLHLCGIFYGDAFVDVTIDRKEI